MSPSRRTSATYTIKRSPIQTCGWFGVYPFQAIYELFCWLWQRFFIVGCPNAICRPERDPHARVASVGGCVARVWSGRTQDIAFIDHESQFRVVLSGHLCRVNFKLHAGVSAFFLLYVYNFADLHLRVSLEGAWSKYSTGKMFASLLRNMQLSRRSQSSAICLLDRECRGISDSEARLHSLFHTRTPGREPQLDHPAPGKLFPTSKSPSMFRKLILCSFHT